MNSTARHLSLGASAGITIAAIVIPFVHLLAESATLVGFRLGVWGNPVQVFIFVISTCVVGVFPWGLWITLTDARRKDIFNDGGETAAYLLAAIGVFVAIMLLACTKLQATYAAYRWFFTPALLVFAVVFFYWRWRKVWQFPKGIGLGGTVDEILALPRT